MRTLAGTVALVISMLACTPANAQTYPSRPINMIVPFPPAGTTDIMARALQAEMSKAIGQTIVIINKGGAAGTLGLIDVVRSAPDGYTVALTPNNPLTAQPHLQKLPYNMDSFRYICLTYYAPYVLIAGPKAPFKTFDEFVKFTKAKSENLVYGHPGLASQPHLGLKSKGTEFVLSDATQADLVLFKRVREGFFATNCREAAANACGPRSWRSVGYSASITSMRRA